MVLSATSAARSSAPAVTVIAYLAIASVHRDSLVSRAINNAQATAGVQIASTSATVQATFQTAATHWLVSSGCILAIGPTKQLTVHFQNTYTYLLLALWVLLYCNF